MSPIRWSAVLISILAVSSSIGCGGDSAAPAAAGGGAGGAAGAVLPGAGGMGPASSALTFFAVPTAAGTPHGITQAPDGNIWFTELRGNKIGHLSPGGVMTEFPLPQPESRPGKITVGPDGNLWFTEAHGVGRITPAGEITVLATKWGGAADITTGPDGNLWLAFISLIVRLSPSGEGTEFRLPAEPGMDAGVRYDVLSGITNGPDGNLWFTNATANKIGRITPAGEITQYPLASFGMKNEPSGITAGPDGNLWFTDYENGHIGRISPAGVMTAADSIAALPAWAHQGDIVVGRDGNLWIAMFDGFCIGKVTPAGMFSSVPYPITREVLINGLTAGPDGAIWFTVVEGPSGSPKEIGKIGRLAI